MKSSQPLAAFLRGIMPSLPNMANAKLRGVFEKLGFKNVRSVISSGNIVFETTKAPSQTMEKAIEKALFDELGIKSPVFIRSKKEIETMIKKDPFKGKTHSRKTYLLVTFLKKKPGVIYKTIDLTQSKTPDYMAEVENKYDKEITTRTWQTILRVAKRF